MSIQGNYMKGNTVIKITSEGLTELKPDKPEEPKEPQREEKVIPFIKAELLDPDPYKDALRKERRKRRRMDEMSNLEVLWTSFSMSLPLLFWILAMAMFYPNKFLSGLGILTAVVGFVDAWVEKRRK